jgi:Domain of unknown function (DUF3598)
MYLVHIFLVTSALCLSSVRSFAGRPSSSHLSSSSLSQASSRSVRLILSSSPPLSDTATTVQDDSAIQWELFEKYHGKGSWKGIWTTYDYIGDVVDETVASVDFVATSTSTSTTTIQHGDQPQQQQQIVQTHHIVVGARRSDCATCFDSTDIKSFPVATFTPGNLRKARLAACSMVHGPSLLRSGGGVMATELVLSHGDGRVRVIFQHAPVWARGVAPGSCPPQGLKLFRTLVSREALRPTAPTAESEAANPPNTTGNPTFYRPVPPFHWHKMWAGTSWTWGPNTGNRGWMLEELEEADTWHGMNPVERWNLRLPGGIFLQAPRIVTDAGVELCRLAWLPDDETLLRVEAGILALQPMLLEDDALAGFEPPTLASLRCDVLKSMGDLQGETQFARVE